MVHPPAAEKKRSVDEPAPRPSFLPLGNRSHLSASLPTSLALTVDVTSSSNNQLHVPRPNQRGPKTPTKESPGSSTTDTLTATQTRTSPSNSSTQPSPHALSDITQNQSARPEVHAHLNGDCYYFVNSVNSWRKATFHFSGRYLQLRYTEIDGIGHEEFLENVNYQNYSIESAMMGREAVKRSIRLGMKTEFPTGCTVFTFLLFPTKSNCIDLRFQFSSERVFVDFYEYWKRHVSPPSRSVVETNLYLAMRSNPQN